MTPALEAEMVEEQEVPLGEVWRWTQDCGVTVSMTSEIAKIEVWNDYATWCQHNGLRFLEPPKFNAKIRSIFGIEGRRGIFPLAIARPLTVIGG